MKTSKLLAILFAIVAALFATFVMIGWGQIG